MCARNAWYSGVSFVAGHPFEPTHSTGSGTTHQKETVGRSTRSCVRMRNTSFACPTSYPCNLANCYCADSASKVRRQREASRTRRGTSRLARVVVFMLLGMHATKIVHDRLLR